MLGSSTVQSTLSCILLKNGQTYFKNPAVFTPQGAKAFLVIFNIMHERINTSLTHAKHIRQSLLRK